MKRALPTLLIGLLLAPVPSCPAGGADSTTDSAAPAQVFRAAAEAYDEGRYSEAAGLYQDLLADGFGGTEVLFNLGNTKFRSGDIGQAVLHYRRAWYLAPRDEDIRANLGFALEHTGADMPPVSPAGRMLRRLSLGEWVLVATLAWWLLGGLAIAALLAPVARRMAIQASAGLVLILVTALAGTGQWLRLYGARERVVILPDQTARYAPLDGAESHFSLPAGSVVTTMQTAGDWIRVGAGRRDGWIPAKATEAVHPRP